jgi:hypothetical protein
MLLSDRASLFVLALGIACLSCNATCPAGQSAQNDGVYAMQLELTSACGVAGIDAPPAYVRVTCGQYDSELVVFSVDAGVAAVCEGASCEGNCVETASVSGEMDGSGTLTGELTLSGTCGGCGPGASFAGSLTSSPAQAVLLFDGGAVAVTASDP